MVYRGRVSVLLVEKGHEFASRAKKALKRYGFDVDLSRADNVDEPTYADHHCAVVHVNGRDARSVKRLDDLRRRHPTTALIIAPLSEMNGVSSEAAEDQDGTIYLTGHFTADDLADAIKYGARRSLLRG